MTRREDGPAPFDSDEELDTLDNSPRARLWYVLRRIAWTGLVALLCVGALVWLQG